MRSISAEDAEAAHAFGKWTRPDMEKFRRSVYAPYLSEIRDLVKAGETVAKIHREVNTRYNLNYNVETLRHFVWWKCKDVMPKDRRWGNQYTNTGKCKRGHDWTEENERYTWDSSRGKLVRYCRTCANVKHRVWAAKRREKKVPK